MAAPSGSRQVNNASRLLRELLYESDNDILVALREDFTPSEMARLSDLIGSRIFDVLVNLTAPPVHAAPTQGGNNDGNPAVSAPALPSTPADGGAGQAGHAYPPAPGWEDVGLSPRSTLNGPWSSREGWIVDLRLPQQPTTITRPPSWPYADLFILDWYDVPWWVELQAPATDVQHLPVRGYCTHVCSVRDPVPNCQGLCFRPVMKGARTAHHHHHCLSCHRTGAS